MGVQTTDFGLVSKLDEIIGNYSVGGDGSGMSTRRMSMDNLLALGTFGNIEARDSNSSIGTDQAFKFVRSSATTFTTLTVPSPSGFDEGFTAQIYNDSARGWYQSISGLTGFILWPGQGYFLRKINGNWRVVLKPNRWKITSTLDMYVAAASAGLAQNFSVGDGLSADTPLADMYTAVMLGVAQQFDLDVTASPQVTVNMAAGVHDSILHLPAILAGQSGNASIRILGAVDGSGNPTSAISVSGTSSPLELFDNAQLEIGRLALQSTGGVPCITMRSASRLIITDIVNFVQATGSYHMYKTEGSSVRVDADYKISGSGNGHVYTDGPGSWFDAHGRTITFSADCGFDGDAFTNSQGGARQNWSGVSFDLAGHTVTGVRAKADFGGQIISPAGDASTGQFPGDSNETANGSRFAIFQ